MTLYRARNRLSGRQATAFAKIDGVVYELFQVKTLEVTVEKSDTEINTLRNNWTQHAGGVLSGKIEITAYFGSPVFHEIMDNFSKTGIDTYFDLTITNNDPSSDAGAQTAVYHDCNLTSITPSKIDVDADVLEESYSITFSGMEYVSKFTELNS